MRGLALSLVSTRGGEDALLGARCVRSTEHECDLPTRGGGDLERSLSALADVVPASVDTAGGPDRVG